MTAANSTIGSQPSSMKRLADRQTVLIIARMVGSPGRTKPGAMPGFCSERGAISRDDRSCSRAEADRE
jgi:hypothetical protein